MASLRDCASGVEASKTGSAQEAYNSASKLGRSLARRAGVDVVGVLDDGALDALGQAVRGDQALADRLAHFRHESECVNAVSRALSTGDTAALGEAVRESQEGAERLLRDQIPETIYLAASARAIGAAAASAFGAGYGGAVWALVKASGTESFLLEWESAYQREYPDRTGVFVIEDAGPAASFLDGTPVW